MAGRPNTGLNNDVKNESLIIDESIKTLLSSKEYSELSNEEKRVENN